MMKLAIIGARTLPDFDKSAIKECIPPETTAILSGGAVGIDTLAEEVAAELGLPFEAVLPNYQKYGKKAPIVRNKAIVEKADRVLAVWDYRSRGTAHVIATCIGAGVPIRVIGQRIASNPKAQHV